MSIKVKLGAFGIALVCVCAMTQSASAITAEVARTCDALVAKSFPPREVGNPAAGSAKGSAKDQRDYFAKCVANEGKMDGNPPNDPKSK
jgi:hypothetical protein